MLKRLLTTLTVVTGGLELGRRVVDKQIERRVNEEIEAAKDAANAELNKSVNQFLRENLTRFLIVLGVKASILAAIVIGHRFDLLTAQGFRVVALLAILAFIVRDVAVTAPIVGPALQLARRHDWSLKGIVTAIVFERAYAEALLKTQTGANKLWIAMSRYSAEQISEDIANALTEICTTTSYARIRARAATAVSVAALVLAAYSAFAFTVLRTA